MEEGQDALDARHVAIIGGSSGIGLALAGRARRAGAHVTLLARDPARLAAAADRIGGAQVRPLDLADADGTARAVAALGVVDHLVITAGSVDFRPIADGAPESWRAILEERIVGPLAAIRAAAPGLRGSITLFSGTIAYRPRPGAALLAASAAGVEAIVRTLALELAPIRVNGVAPGLLDTPLTDRALGEAKGDVLAAAAARLPVGRIGSADDVAAAALMVLRNPYVTGTIVGIDGGARLI